MPVDTRRIDLLLQYALLAAGENDEVRERELGPIHLIKYVYLGDVAFARRNAGETFTSVSWQFYKFGPWAEEVYQRVQPALLAVGANAKYFKSDYEGKEDWVRWTLRDDSLLAQKERGLPASITLRLRTEIKTFGQDTPALLDYVYRTEPMLNAAPNEYLDFFSLVPQATRAEPRTTARLRMESLSPGDRKALQERIASARALFRGLKGERLINPVKHPRYDEVYASGIAWLESLAGEPLQEGEHIAEFSEQVWKSPSRKGTDVS
jgi:hypothetical protein